MPEYAGNCSIATANGNAESADMLVGAGMLNFLIVYVQQALLMLLLILLVILAFGVQFPCLYMNNSYPNCQFAGLTCTGGCYWYPVLSHPERDQLQNCLENALAEFKANKHTKLNQACQAKKYSYINSNIAYGNETIKFVITTKFLGVQIDNNLT
jgi:hypothetical protein